MQKNEQIPRILENQPHSQPTTTHPHKSFWRTWFILGLFSLAPLFLSPVPQNVTLIYCNCASPINCPCIGPQVTTLDPWHWFMTAMVQITPIIIWGLLLLCCKAIFLHKHHFRGGYRAGWSLTWRGCIASGLMGIVLFALVLLIEIITSYTIGVTTLVVFPSSNFLEILLVWLATCMKWLLQMPTIILLIVGVWIIWPVFNFLLGCLRKTTA